MKTILCFGDSLTWGFNPDNFERFLVEERWTTLLQVALGDDCRVIEEGLSGRTTVLDTPYQENRSGVSVLPMLLESHAPIDLVVLMLGTNDLQSQFSIGAKQAAAGCASCISKILSSAAGPAGLPPQIVLMAPPAMKQPAKAMEIFFDDSIEESQKIALNYQKIADMYQVDFFDAGSVVETSTIDGIHLNKASQPILAEHLARLIQPMLKR